MDTIKKYVVDDQFIDQQIKFDDYVQAVEYCYQQEIIYYSKAMNYLMENDCSLRESMAIACEYGIDDPSELNSEYLATIHYQDALINSIGEAEA